MRKIYHVHLTDEERQALLGLLRQDAPSATHPHKASNLPSFFHVSFPPFLGGRGTKSRLDFLCHCQSRYWYHNYKGPPSAR